MMYCYNENTKQYAKVLSVDDETGMALVVIDDKSQTMAWKDFVREFKYLVKIVDEQHKDNSDE